MSEELATIAERATSLELDGALAVLAAHAGELDAHPRFPEEGFDALRAAGVTQAAADRDAASLASEIDTVRSVAAADASTARILDGHLNAVERVALLAPEPLRSVELQRVASGELLLGVWGADPAPGEGEPAWIERTIEGTIQLAGTKTFCSGAGGVDRALVVAHGPGGRRVLVYVDAESETRIDRDWYRASGLKASESHRVSFDGTPVLAVLGGPDELASEPYFSADAIRSAATWAGLADAIFEQTLARTAGVELDAVRLRRIGEMRLALSSIDRWLEHAGALLDAAKRRAVAAARTALSDIDAAAANGLAGSTDREPFARERAVSVEARVAISEAARLIAASAAEVCGSRALIDGGDLDRARRDLDLFLLQHRLDRKLVELGALARGGARR